jgi:hypothetical protein
MNSDEEALAKFEAFEAEREAAYQAKREAARANNHIRKRAGKNLGTQWYSHSHRVQFIEGYIDPMSQTLCGGEATIEDISWADARYPKQREYVACQRCKEIRLADPKARR